MHASTWFAPMLLPIIVYLLIKDHEVKRVSLQAFFFHIIMVVLISVSWFFSFILIGLPFLIVFGLMAVICPILGIVNALQDQRYDYPIVKWFIR